MGADLIRLRTVMSLLELEFADRAAGFATTDEYDVQGSTSPIDWVRHNCHMSAHSASRSVRVGEQRERVPLSTEAVLDGRIGFEHLALIAATADAVSNGSATATPFDEGPLLRLAEEHSVSRFRFDCSHVRHAFDAQGFLGQQLDAVENRRLELKPCEDGSLIVHGLLDSVGGATLRTTLDALARPMGVGDDRKRERRLADALIELAAHGLDAGVVPQRAGDHVHLQVTASLETLLGMTGAPAGEMDFSSPIAAATVRRLACDAGVTRVLMDAKSAVIDVGRTTRVPSVATRRALNARDRGCVWPGCDRPAGWTAAHHVVFWGHGGDTDIDNIVLICHLHHWMVHEGGWVLARTDNATVRAVPPRARSYVPRARPPDGVTAA